MGRARRERPGPCGPGERIIAILTVRDIAGNLDRTAAQDILVTRYLMRREASQYAARQRSRARAFADGGPPAERAIPARGDLLRFFLSGWTGEDAPRLSGLPMQPGDAGDWSLEQMVPLRRPGVVVQRVSGRPGRLRVLPLGIAKIDAAGASPLVGPVRGTGTLSRYGGPVLDGLGEGLELDAWIEGQEAVGLMVDADDGEARLAMSLVDPRDRVALTIDARKQRFVRMPVDATRTQWAGAAPVSAPAAQPAASAVRKFGANYPATVFDELVLPHTDLRHGSVAVHLTLGETLLEEMQSARDFRVEFAEGRVALTDMGRVKIVQVARAAREANGPPARLLVTYDVVAGVAPRDETLSRDMIIEGDGRALLRRNAGEEQKSGTGAVTGATGVIDRVRDWFQDLVGG